MNDITKKLSAIEKAISTIRKGMATKDDLKGMATKDDLKNLKAELKGDMKDMATKDDIRNMATKNDLETGLKGLEKRLIEKIDDAQMEIIEAVDKHKADKVKVDNLEERVDRLEDNAGLPPFPTQ